MNLDRNFEINGLRSGETPRRPDDPPVTDKKKNLPTSEDIRNAMKNYEKNIAEYKRLVEAKYDQRIAESIRALEQEEANLQQIMDIEKERDIQQESLREIPSLEPLPQTQEPDEAQ